MTILRDLLIVQAGRELASDTYGCDVAPTVQLEGIDSFTVTPVLRNEQLGTRYGTLAPAHVSVRTIEEASASIGGFLSYDDAPYWLDGLFGGAYTSANGGWTSDADGVVSRLYHAPLSVYDSNLGEVRHFTFVQGDVSTDTGDYNIQGAIAKSATFTFETGAAAKFSVDFIGRESNADSLASDVTNRTVTYVMGNHGSIYIDPSSDTAGSGTALSATAWRAELSIETNRAPTRHLGALNPDGYRDSKWTGSLSLSLEMTSTVLAFMTALLGGSSALEKVVRLKFTTGSGATERLFQIDFNGIVINEPSVFTDVDGVVSMDLNLTGQYNAKLANWLNITCINATAALA